MKVNNKIILSVIMGVAIIGVASWIFLSVKKVNQTNNLLTGENNQQTVETKLQAPNQDALAKAEEAIRTFMALPNLTFQYIIIQKHPSNFTIGKTTAIADGAIRTDVPPEWDRPVYVIQQKEYINERCEVYEYEVLAKTNQVIEVHVRYPKEIEQTLATTGLKASECESYGSMEIPLIKKSQKVRQMNLKGTLKMNGEKLQSKNPNLLRSIFINTKMRADLGLTQDYWLFILMRMFQLIK